MNADLTFNSVVFKKSWDKPEGSERRSSARGVNIPDLMMVRKQDYVDSATKVAGHRHLIRFDREAIDAVTGQRYVVSFQVVLAIPSLATSTDISTIVATGKAAVADADLITNVLNSEL